MSNVSLQMEHIAPLLQTILWVGLIAGIVWRFHVPIYGLLSALQKRIEGGSNVKAGPFEITEQIKPQEPGAQKAKAEMEAQEVVAEQAQLPVAEQAQLPIEPVRPNIQARYFLAEDLVMRAIQAEYGTPVSRQVTAGRDSGFDGLLSLNGRTTIVEVKYVRTRGSNPTPRFRPAIKRLSDAVRQYGWSNAQIILALVFEREEDMGNAHEILTSGFADNPVPVVVRSFSLNQLKSQFGVTDPNEG